ncbi:MAG: hypothetical protein B7Z60_05010 [Ferrovum sp. 37-45-19]|jgi:hypothetical protein|uniref:hypothetical protein n=1 Tax=Ferrovum sp. JA12 TaxID=1356299 RepID=UPI000702C891|nr:hypothetical protein [Ferrovum sp. JA12]OYV79710.1 MAG: hypothetical protein B7Z65_04995 [Ferrovum sp. 21-44-67]OYV94308.1 MAG: hypothetical protein B7Z60_05010 [Ferrovum sp. 37-45-19]OZB32390.1 MAG: hypothetical protein B7X47_06720 [Ferrovum sp. 34-44-207]HQT80562.1 hypothetical protein [Ferrovaceae bacterium]KRH79651.1 hypothetical protein FERRO_07230 [Ferrovum sp. JA12]
MIKTLFKPYSCRYLRVLVLVCLLCAIQWLESTHYHLSVLDHDCVVCQLVSHQVTHEGGGAPPIASQNWYLISLITIDALCDQYISTLLIVFFSRAPPPY